MRTEKDNSQKKWRSEEKWNRDLQEHVHKANSLLWKQMTYAFLDVGRSQIEKATGALEACRRNDIEC